MILNRSVFSNVEDEVKEEICCIIPSGTVNNQITEIASGAFHDWENLEYVCIPKTILIVQDNAFLWDKVKVVFVDRTRTLVNDIPSNVKVFPVSGNEESIFEILKEVLAVKKRFEFAPEKVKEANLRITDKMKEFFKDTSLKEKEIDARKEKIQGLIYEVDKYSKEVEKTASSILSRLDNLINERLQGKVSEKFVEFEELYSLIKDEENEVRDIINKCNGANDMMKNLLNELHEEIENKKRSIKEEVDKAIADANRAYSQSRDSLVAKMVEDATDALIEKNPCKTFIINIDGVRKKFQTKELFHKEFETVLKLASTKIPVLLKGPAGSGKNVIVEQIAKALDLDFRYLNDVTDEFKVMGFVDANGNYIETQFFKAFTSGAMMFVDEIDNSNPSALLAINAAIGTGDNHYMSFPDGELYKAHEDFRLIAAANTFGTGADMIYSGRQALDGASLNRFIPVVIDYDRELESSLINHEEILKLYWEVRDIIASNTIRHVISTRNIVNANRLLEMNCFDLGQIFDWTIIQGMDRNDLDIICSRINTRDYYSNEFLSHAKRKYKVNSRI